MQNCKWHDPTCKCQPFLDQPKVCPMVQSSKINIPTIMVCPILSATVQSFNRNIWCVQQKLNLMMMRRRSFFFFCSKNPDLYEVWLILQGLLFKKMIDLITIYYFFVVIVERFVLHIHHFYLNGDRKKTKDLCNTIKRMSKCKSHLQCIRKSGRFVSAITFCLFKLYLLHV